MGVRVSYRRVEVSLAAACLMLAAGAVQAQVSPAAGATVRPTAGKALGYAQLLAVLDDTGAVTGSLASAVEATVRTTRRFVRRQRSWFRRDPRIRWLDAASADLVDTAALTLETCAH